MEPLSIQEALDYCLENPEGLGAQELLDKFPQYREEMESLLGVAREIAELTSLPVPAQRRETTKVRLMATASARAASTQGGKLAQAPQTMTRPSAPPASRRPARPAPWFLRPGWVTPAAAIMVVTFVWWLAARSLPASPFYNVKLASETIMLNITSDPVNRALLHTSVANGRLYDLRTMQERGELAQAGPALDSYSRNLTASNNIRESLPPGEARTRVTRAIYKACAAGKITLGSLAVDLATLPPTVRDNIRQMQAKVDSIENSTAQALISEGIDPNSVIYGPDVTTLLTPVAVALGSTPNPAMSSTALPSAISTVTSATNTVANATSTIAPTHTVLAGEQTPAPSATSPARIPAASATRTRVAPIATRTATPKLKPSPTRPARATPEPQVTSTPTLTGTPIVIPIPTNLPLLPSSTPTTLLIPPILIDTPTSQRPEPQPTSTAEDLPPPPPAPTATAVARSTREVKPTDTPIKQSASPIPAPGKK